MTLLFIVFVVFMAANSQGKIVETGKIVKNATKAIDLHPLYSDSLSSSYIIFIEKEVKAHYHKNHTELVYILEGEGDFLMNDKTYNVKCGDYIIIPKRTIHAVTVRSQEPMKVISIQTPLFLGEDRHYVKHD